MITREPATHAPGAKYSETDVAAVMQHMLDGADPGAYVVARIDDLVWQVQAAVNDEVKRQHGRPPSGAKVAFRTARYLQELGLVVDLARIKDSS